MSEVFEGYERQYCEISASLSRKCSSAVVLNGEQKKQKISEIKSGIDDAEAWIRKMDLEARSLPPSVKAGLLAKLREYKSDLNNLKSELKRISTANPNQAAREELLESGMADTLAVCCGLSFVHVLGLITNVNCHASLFFDFSWRTM
ncbi:putative Vesicle transport v-SNARE 13 [Cocos nucifera]|uniref:Putative Vesicle transport v-SNARE 13 n=1 Tax=Cocos nucifera TaxID=13894 RepID=A0A8K0IAK8_COCNU|nr:putative Vesicle transport v-SNARE 13 [Cocos nucifera]